MKRVLFLALAASIGLTGCGDDGKQFTGCVDKGVAYFKEIGSYPTLKSEPNRGRSAEDVANERCANTTHAFD